jgi:uncharacterized membrane protein YcgQ (UPF0703/DUF1980 family)
MPFKITINQEYKPLINDIMRFFTLLIVVNIIMFMSNPTDNVLFGSAYTKLMIAILLGVSTYWLVVEQLIVFD